MNLRTYLEINHITARAFARAVGVSASTISRGLSGKIMFSPQLMQRIYDATGKAVTPNDLMQISGSDVVAPAKRKLRVVQ